MPLTLSQIVQTVKTDVFSSNADVFTDVTGLSAVITPSANTSSIWVLCSVAAGASGSGNPLYFRLMRNGVPIDVGDAAGSRLQCSGGVGHHFAGNPTNWTCNFVDAPASIVPVTYQVQVVDPAVGGPCYINRTSTDSDSTLYGRSSSSITLVEIPV